MKLPEVILPWQKNNWDLFSAYLKQQRIPQALMICGRPGLGKVQLARQIAQSLLCNRSLDSGIYCDTCHSCTLFKAETHPDFLFLEPETEAKNINVTQIRSLISKLQLKPQFDSYRIIIVNPAELLNQSAANSFLKCLEEPAEKTVMLLVTDKPSKLPATIISRCQKMKLFTPDKQLAINWLQQQKIPGDLPVLLSIALGSPLLAEKYAQQQLLSLRNHCFEQWIELAHQHAEPVTIAEEWLQHSDEPLIGWVISWIIDIIKIQYHTDISNLYNPDLKQSLQELSQKLNLQGLFEFYDKLLQSKTNPGSNLNRQLFFEEILINWSQLNTNY